MKKRILNYILRKYTDYYELKKRNEELVADISALVKNYNSEKSIATRMLYKLIEDAENSLFAGTAKRSQT